MAPFVNKLVGEKIDLGGLVQGLVVAWGEPKGVVGCAARKGVEAIAPSAIASARRKKNLDARTN